MLQQGICYIIAPLYSGEEQERIMSADKDDFVICADGGYAAAERYGIVPDLVIGDFDSMPIERVNPHMNVIRLPIHKDDTDMVVCLREGRKHGYHRFVVVGCLGGRLCHTLANLQCAYDCALRSEEIWLSDCQNLVTILLPGQYELTPPQNRFFSLLSYTEKTTGITLTGTEWTLDRANLDNRFPLGVSNKPIAEKVHLSFETGALTLIYAADKTSAS